MNIAFFWDLVSHILTDSFQGFERMLLAYLAKSKLFYPEDGSSISLWNISTNIAIYTTYHMRRIEPSQFISFRIIIYLFIRPMYYLKDHEASSEIWITMASSDSPESDLLTELLPQKVGIAGYSGNSKWFWIRITGPTVSTLAQCFSAGW
jgi:hypothetical protein